MDKATLGKDSSGYIPPLLSPLSSFLCFFSRRTRDTKVLGLLMMASQPTTGLCGSTLSQLASLDKTALTTDTWMGVELVRQEIEQRLAQDGTWFLYQHRDEVLPEPAMLVNVLDESAEKVFQAFCWEKVGVRKTFLVEHFGAFTGGDVAKWFGTRTNAGRDGTKEDFASKWISNGWIAGDGHRILPTYSIWRLTEKGFAVWNSGILFYEHNQGTRRISSEEHFLATAEQRLVERLEDTAKKLAASSELDPKSVSGSHLCNVLMKLFVIPLDAAVELAGQLFAAGFLMRIVDSDSESDSSSSGGGVGGGADHEEGRLEEGEGDEDSKHKEAFHPSVFRMYGFVELHKPHILNGRRRHVGTVPDAKRALQLSKECYEQIRDLWDAIKQHDLQFSAVSSRPAWTRLAILCYELRAVDLDGLTGDAALAFWVNVHNSLFLHAYVTHRERFNPPESAKERACYLVGNIEFNMRDIFEGIVLGRSIFAEEDARLKWRLKVPTLAGLLLSNNYRMIEVALTESNLQDELSKQAALDFQGVELCEGDVFRISRVVEAVVKDQLGEPIRFIQLIFPHLTKTWQGIVGRILENKMPLTIGFNDEQEIYLWGGSLEDQQSVGAGKDLWALGVMKQSNEARAELAAVKGESQMLQMSFEQASSAQIALKAAVEQHDEVSKVLEEELLQLKRTHQQLSEEKASRTAALAHLRTRVTVGMNQVRASHASLKAFLQNECGGVAHKKLEALYERLSLLVPPLDEARNIRSNSLGAASGAGGGGGVGAAGEGGSSGNASGVGTEAGSHSAEHREFLLTRDPLTLGAWEDAPSKWVEATHLKWLKEKCKNLVPTLPGDDAFLATIVRVHSELAEDASLLRNFFEKRLSECYSRYFSSWRERIALLLSEVLTTKSEVPAIVAANGWFQGINFFS